MTFIEQLSGSNNLDDIRCYWKINHKYLLSLPPEERKKVRDCLFQDFQAKFRNQIPAIIYLLEETAKSLLGSTLVAPNKKRYTITMLEIYADGIWDESGDYIKEIFRSRQTKAIGKMMQGPIPYYFGGRIDIKVFADYLPFSFLIRNLKKEDGTLSSPKDRKFGVTSWNFKHIVNLSKIRQYNSVNIN